MHKVMVKTKINKILTLQMSTGAKTPLECRLSIPLCKKQTFGNSETVRIEQTCNKILYKCNIVAMTDNFLFIILPSLLREPFEQLQ